MTSLTIAVGQLEPFDAGALVEEVDTWIIQPPREPMIDQLLARLDALPDERSDRTPLQTRRLGVGLAALCVRWGSYLATLLDESAPLHPDAAASHAGADAPSYSLITDGEMKRMNIEVSYNLARIAQRYHERGMEGLDALLAKAAMRLPMPQRAVPMDRELAGYLVPSLVPADPSSARRHTRVVPIEHADRAIANVLAVWGWRNTAIETIHAGGEPRAPLRPQQRRLRPQQARRLMREISAKFASHYFYFDTFFGDGPTYDDLPRWPASATALANSFLGAWASAWSLTEESAPVILERA